MESPIGEWDVKVVAISAGRVLMTAHLRTSPVHSVSCHLEMSPAQAENIGGMLVRMAELARRDHMIIRE